MARHGVESAVDHRTEQNRSSAEVRAKVLRSFSHHRGGGPTKSILDTMRQVELRTPAGLIVGRTGSFEPDIDRLDRVSSRIVRGLYWHHCGERVPETHGVGVYIVAAFTPKDHEGREAVETLISIAMGGNRARLGDVFEYDYRLLEAGASAWVMQLYSSFVVVAVTIDRANAPNERPLW